MYGEYLFEEVAHECLAHDGSAAFVAQNVSEGRDVLLDALSVVETAVGTGAEDACYARLMAAKGDGCAQEIAIYLDRCLGELLTEGFGDFCAVGLDATSAEEMYLADLATLR